MAQLEERLSSLLDSDENRQQLIQLASMLGGNAFSSEQSESQTDGINTAGTVQEDTSQTDFSSSGPSSSSSGSNKTLDLFAVLPKLLDAMSGNGSSLDSKRVNLIRAISPYLNSRSGSIDRAIRLASVAKAARETLGILGR